MQSREELEAYLEAVRWVVWGGIGSRRAGTLGEVVALEGKDSSGSPIRVERIGRDAWRLVDSTGASDRDLTGAEVIAEAGSGPLTLTQARVRHDLPALLFQAAAAAAEESLVRAQEAERKTGLTSGDEESDAAFEFVMATSQQDAAVRSAISAVMLAVAAAEAQVNGWAEARGGWAGTGRKSEDRKPLVQKCKILARRAGATVNLGSQPYKDLADVVTLRNKIVHSKGEHLVPLIGPTTIPGRSLSVDARRACFVVRQSLVDLTRLIGENPPRYLANCPPCGPDDDEGWRGAVVMTGVWDDPDFPKILDLLEGTEDKDDRP